MKDVIDKKKMVMVLLCGLLGALLMAASDWTMIYGNTAFQGQLAWLTEGVRALPAGRFTLAMALAFPAVVFYAIGLLGVRHLLTVDSQKRVYCGLTTLGMTPWLCLHLFYVMILFLLGHLSRMGLESASIGICQDLFAQFSWIVLAGEALMLLPFFYLIWVQIRGGSVYPGWAALVNPLTFYILLKGLTLVMADSPVRLAFQNGLMSEAMALWFLFLLLTFPKYSRSY